MPSRQTQRRGKNFSKLSKKKAKKYCHFTEEAQPDRFADTEGEYWYEETEGVISFIDPVEHCDYESSEEEEDESADKETSAQHLEDSNDTIESITAASKITVKQPHTPWERLLDEESESYYYYNHNTYESSWDKPLDLIKAEKKELRAAKMEVIKARSKRLKKLNRAREDRMLVRQKKKEEKKKEIQKAVFEGFYAEKEVRHNSQAVLLDLQKRRLQQLNIAAKYFAKDMLSKAASGLLLARRSGARSLECLLTLAWSHQLLWNKHFDAFEAFECDFNKALTRPPPTTAQYRRRKQLLLTALESYSVAIPMSLTDSAEYQSSSQCDASVGSGSIMFGRYTDVTAGIVLQTAKIFNIVGNYEKSVNLLQRLFSQSYIQNASAGTALSGAILNWGVLKAIGGRQNYEKSAKWIRWVADQAADTFKHSIELQIRAHDQISTLKNGPPQNINYSNMFMNTTPPGFFNLHNLDPDDSPRVLRVICLLVYSQMMVNLNKRAEGMVTLLDCFSIQGRGEGWTDEIHETPVSWFNSVETWVAAGFMSLDTLGEDGVHLADFCYSQAVLRGDGSIDTLLALAVVQFKLGKIDDAIFTLSNVLSGAYYNYRARTLMAAWSTPYAKRFEEETIAGDCMIRFFRVSLAKIRIRNLKIAAQEQLRKDEENLKKLLEFWQHKNEGWAKRCYLKWVQFWREAMHEKNAAAGILQNRCRGINAKKDLARRKAKKKHVEGLIAMNLAKLLGNSKGKYLLVWKQFILMRHQEKASYKLAEFARIVLAKRKVRLERLIAKALGKSTLLMARQCLRAWIRWTLDLKLDKCASSIQRRWRGLAGRRNFLKELAKVARQEEIIAMALGKGVEKLVHRVFERWRDDYFFEKQSRAALVMQTKTRGLLGKRAIERKKEQERKVKEMAYLVAGKNTLRLQRKFIALLALGLQEKAALKFQTVFRGKKGREELKVRKERERRVKALCRRCLGDAGRVAMLGWKEYIVLVRKEKRAAAVKLQTRYRMRQSKKRLEWEKKEKIRKEELIAMALGRNTERVVRSLFREWKLKLEEKHGAVLMQGLFRKKKSRKEVEALREKKRKQEWLISMALGRGDQRMKIYFLNKWAGFVRIARFSNKIVRCYRAYIAKTIVKRLKWRREKRREGIIKMIKEFREHMLGVGLRRLRDYVRADKAASKIQKFVRKELSRIRLKRIRFFTVSITPVIVGLSSTVAASRWISALKINRRFKIWLSRIKARELREKAMRLGEIYCRMTVRRQRRIYRACNIMWQEQMVRWKVAYGVLQRSFRCALARRERLRRIEYERLLLARLEVKVKQRNDRTKMAVFRAFEEMMFDRVVCWEEAKVWVDGVFGGLGGLGEGEGEGEGRDEEKKEEVVATASRPKIMVTTKQQSLSNLIYAPLNGKRQATSHALKAHYANAIKSNKCNDAESSRYYACRNMVEKIGIFEWDGRRHEDMLTVNDREFLFKAATVVNVHNCEQSDVDEIASILAGCFEDGGDDAVECSVRKLIITGGGKGAVPLDTGVLLKHVLKPSSKIVSLSFNKINFGFVGCRNLALNFVRGRRRPLTPSTKEEGGAGISSKKIHQLQELTLDDVCMPSWGSFEVLRSLSSNDEFCLRKVNFSNNNLGDSALLGEAWAEFVCTQKNIETIELNNCNLGTLTSGGYVDDNVVSSIFRGITKANEVVVESFEDDYQVNLKRVGIRDLRFNNNLKVGDRGLAALSTEVKKWGEMGAKIGYENLVKVDNLEFGSCSVTSLGAGLFCEAILYLDLDGGMYGLESIIREISLNDNCITDEGAKCLVAVVEAGVTVGLDGNIVSDGVVNDLGAEASRSSYGMKTTIFPNDIFDRPSSGLYAGKAEYKLPEIEWKGDLFGVAGEGERKRKTPAEVRKEKVRADEICKAKWWQVQTPVKLRKVDSEVDSEVDFSRTGGSLKGNVRKVKGKGKRKWTHKTIVEPVSMLNDFARLEDWADLPPRAFRTLSRGGKRKGKLHVTI
ncbi:hypothetical protein TrVE_jg5292 [Triparma verrucosa]|uniref:WW domain-containing protein n=1 Tax=Triparma verrucosa TaxID=1606542 RepID=A0A9W7FP00_9STRA|nr:hypothetical protein TrVE_jg5292 [Triparma verrucosa]